MDQWETFGVVAVRGRIIHPQGVHGHSRGRSSSPTRGSSAWFVASRRGTCGAAVQFLTPLRARSTGKDVASRRMGLACRGAPFWLQNALAENVTRIYTAIIEFAQPAVGDFWGRVGGPTPNMYRATAAPPGDMVSGPDSSPTRDPYGPVLPVRAYGGITERRLLAHVWPQIRPLWPPTVLYIVPRNAVTQIRTWGRGRIIRLWGGSRTGPGPQITHPQGTYGGPEGVASPPGVCLRARATGFGAVQLGPQPQTYKPGCGRRLLAYFGAVQQGPQPLTYGRWAVPPTPTSPLYSPGTYSWGPNPRHMEGQIRRLQAWGCTCSHKMAPAPPVTSPLYSGGPNPRHVKPLLGATASPPGVWVFGVWPFLAITHPQGVRGLMGSGPYNSPWGARGHVGRGRCAVPRTPTSPLYSFGAVLLGPQPQTYKRGRWSSPPGVGSRCAVPRTPTRPRYRYPLTPKGGRCMAGAAITGLGALPIYGLGASRGFPPHPLRARAIVYGPALQVNSFSGPFRSSSDPYAPALQDSGARSVVYAPALQVTPKTPSRGTVHPRPLIGATLGP
eukprot:gene24102-biopygen16393